MRFATIGESGKRGAPILPALKTTVIVPILLVLGMLSVGAAFQDHFIGDLYLTRNFQNLTIAPWAKVMQTASFIGSAPVVVAAASAATIWFLRKGQMAECLLVVGAVLSLPMVSVVKNMIGRHRPTEDMVRVWHDLDSLSFPSGHSFTAVVIFGMFFYVAPLLVRSKSAVAVIRVASVTMIGLIGMSRVYLGAHWPSDVLGGFLYGGLALGALITMHTQWFKQSRIAAEDV